MTETSQTDVSGIARTATGEINNPTAQPAAATTAAPTSSEPTTTPSTTPAAEPTEPKTVLNEETKPAEKPAEAAKGAPETYAEYKVPDGFVLDAEAKTKADTIFKSLGLTQDQAQSLVDFYTSETKEAFEAPFKAYQDMTAKWRTEAESHPDLSGKLGPGQEVNVRIARFLNGMNDPKLASDFRELMDLTGAGNNQAFIRVIDYAARKLTEGSFVAGTGPSPHGQSAPNRPAPTAAEALWPNLNRNTQ